MQFTTSKVLKILGINRNTFQVWLKEGFIYPGIQRSTKQGEPNLFTRDDLYRIWFFKYLVETGLTREEAARFYKRTDISFENVGPELGQYKYLVITRERIPQVKRGKLVVHEIKKTLGDIHLGKKQVYGLIINLWEIKEEVDSLMSG